MSNQFHLLLKFDRLPIAGIRTHAHRVRSLLLTIQITFSKFGDHGPAATDRIRWRALPRHFPW